MIRINSERDGKNLTFLIVEDHKSLRKSLRHMLSAFFPNSLILEAKDGEDAVSLAFWHHPDVILMDISMPGIGGIESTRRIKKELPMIQVIILTIHDSLEYRTDALAAGASNFIPKSKMAIDLIPAISDLLVHPADKY
jgi:two-component system response regulator DegU